MNTTNRDIRSFGKQTQFCSCFCSSDLKCSSRAISLHANSFYVRFWSQLTIYRTELDSSGQALLTSHPPFLLTERRSGTVLFLRLCLCLFQASSHQWNKRNKHKRKHKKKENVSFSCAYACAYFTSVHTSIFLCLCLCLSHKCEPGLITLLVSWRSRCRCRRVLRNVPNDISHEVVPRPISKLKN